MFTVLYYLLFRYDSFITIIIFISTIYIADVILFNRYLIRLGFGEVEISLIQLLNCMNAS